MASKRRKAIQKFNDFVKDVRQGNFASIYLFLGQEGFLAKQGSNMLIRALLTEADLSWNLAEYDANDQKPGEVVGFLSTLPVLSAKRAAVVSNLHYWKASDTEVLLPLINDMPDYAHLILTATTMDKRTRCYQAINTCGRVIDVEPLETAAAAKWAVERSRSYDLQLAYGGARQLVDLVGPSLWQLDKELEKLSLYKDVNDRVISEDDLLLLTVPSQEVSDTAIFRFVDTLVAGSKAQSIRQLEELLDSGREPLSILAMIARQWRIMALAWEASQSGVSLREVSKNQGIPQFALERALNQSQRIGPQGIRKALAETLKADRDIKKGYHSAPHAVEILVAKLAK
ncbi:MAG: DNA polymerase III subunit delta [Firmicutes bacterium]|nr:DNA polymerase III subunit delta [Bacillota bacterium]